MYEHDNKKILRNSKISIANARKILERYCSNPVIRSVKIPAKPSNIKHLEELGFLLAGYSALQAKFEPLFSDEDITVLMSEEEYQKFCEKNPGYQELWVEYASKVTVQLWSYPVDFPDASTMLSQGKSGIKGIKSVDDYSLYLSLKDDANCNDAGVKEALEKLRRRIYQ